MKPDPHWTNDPDADGAITDLRPADEPDPEPAKHSELNESLTNARTKAFVLDRVNGLGKVRPGLLEECWFYDHGGDMAEMKAAIERSGVRKMRLPKYGSTVFLYPPLEDRGAA